MLGSLVTQIFNSCACLACRRVGWHAVVIYSKETKGMRVYACVQHGDRGNFAPAEGKNGRKGRISSSAYLKGRRANLKRHGASKSEPPNMISESLFERVHDN